MPAAPTPRPLPRALAAALLLGLGAPALLALVAPAVRVHPLIAIGLAYLAAATALVTATAAAPLAALRPLRAALGATVGGLALMALGYALARAGHRAVAAEVASGLVGTAGVLLAATAVGAAVGTRIAHPGHLTAVALASSAADVWSVHAPEGITRAVVEAPDVALQRLLTVSAAVPPSRVPDAAVGFGDVLFAALYLSAAERHGLSRPRAVAAIVAGLAAAGAATFALRRPLPALPFLGAAVVLALPGARRVQKNDRGPTLVAAGLLLVALGRVWLSR